MTAILIGIVFMVLGVWGVMTWFSDMLVVLRGVIPLSLLVGGAVGLITGIGSFQSRRGDDNKK